MKLQSESRKKLVKNKNNDTHIENPYNIAFRPLADSESNIVSNRSTASPTRRQILVREKRLYNSRDKQPSFMSGLIGSQSPQKGHKYIYGNKEDWYVNNPRPSEYMEKKIPSKSVTSFPELRNNPQRVTKDTYRGEVRSVISHNPTEHKTITPVLSERFIPVRSQQKSDPTKSTRYKSTAFRVNHHD